MTDDELEKLKPVGGMQMWYYPNARKFRYPIPTDFEFAYIDQSGEIRITGPFVYASSFFNGIAKVKVSEFEIIDGKQKLKSLDPAHYDSVDALLHPDGTIDRVTEKQTKPSAYDVREGMVLEHSMGEFGYLDSSGKSVIHPQFSVATNFSEGLAAVGKEHRTVSDTKKLEFYYPDTYFYIDKAGKTMISGAFLAAEPFANGLAAVMVQGKWGFIDTTGSVIVPYEFDWAGSFTDDLAPVEKDEKVGFINRSGHVVIPYKFKDARNFSNGLAPATVNAKHWGFINKSGEFVIEPIYLNAFPFSEGLALVYVSTIQS